MTTMLKDVESYKKLLKDMKSTSGSDLYTHLVEVFGHLMRHYPDQPLDKIEEVSYLVKHKADYKVEEFLKLAEQTRYKDVSESLKEYIQTASKLFEAPELGEDEEPPEKAAVGNIPNLLKEGRIYQFAGIDFGEKEYFLLQKSLTKLAEKSSATKLRLWGKIHGTESDYFVAEGITDDDDEGEGEDGKQEDIEPRGSGVNQFVYWVAPDSLADWKQLPDISPAYLKASRLIKVSFTGDLERKIITNPFFHGKEKHYLRAQIARIHHGTTLVPKGLYCTQEADVNDIERNDPDDEENKYVPQTENQLSLKNWCHYPKGILKNCRTGHTEPEVPEGEDIEPEELLKQIEAADPYEARLKAITDDGDVEKGIPAWNLRFLGDSYRQPTLNGKTEHNGVVVVRSLRWIGSTTVWKGDKWYQIYVGNGHKNEAQSYFPVDPPIVPVDPEDLEEQPEPNPLEADQPAEGEGANAEAEGEGEKEAAE